MINDGSTSDLVHGELIQTQYRQARNNILAENLCLIYMTASALIFTPWKIVVAWVALEISTQIYRTFWMIRRFARGWPSDNFTAYWARHHAIYQTGIAFIWGGAMFLFVHDGNAMSVTLVVCGLVTITSGTVPGLSYNPPALYGFVSVVYTMMVARLLLMGGIGHAMLALAVAFYGAVLFLMSRVQTEAMASVIRIRFENKQLLDALTEQKATAEAARASAESANLAKSQFLAAASHDLRQPLYALSLLSGMVRGFTTERQNVEVIDQIEANVTALESLFNGLLDISRLDAEVVSVVPEPMSVDALFDRLDNYMRPIAEELGLDLRFRSDGTNILSDPMLIEQVMINLGTNALRNTRKGGVLIAARKRNGAVRLEVWDTGIGIASENLVRIFDEFVQVGNPERNRRKGMGLGLAIVKRSARLLQSEISVDSVPGRGSLFYLFQPLTEQAPPMSLPDEISHGDAALNPHHILVVEDDPNVRMALTQLMAQWGVGADFAATDKEALALVSAGGIYTMALVDYRLPGPRTGIDVILEIRRQHSVPQPRTYLVTGDMDPEILALADARNIQVLHKPLHPSRLRQLFGQG